MISFAVEGMSCNHCVQAITASVKDLDPHAKVSVNLESKRVDISAGTRASEDYREAIREAGYEVVGTTD